MAALPTRRFGRTELEIPLLSLGGMRFQQSWTDLPAGEITAESQVNLEATLQRAVDRGFIMSKPPVTTAVPSGSWVGLCRDVWMTIACSRARCLPAPIPLILRRSSS